MYKCDERIESLKKMNISDSSIRLIEETGYDRMKRYIRTGSTTVLTFQFKKWLKKCPEIEEYLFYWALSHGEPNPTEEKIVKDLLNLMVFNDFVVMLVRACHFDANLLRKGINGMPVFLRTLVRIVDDDNGEDRMSIRRKNWTLKKWCDDYFNEIYIFMPHLEG